MDTPYTPLTIDRAATKERLLSDTPLNLYAHRRRIPTSTLCRILLDGASAYPYQAREKSKFQRVLRRLKRDGYLVEQSAEAA